MPNETATLVGEIAFTLKGTGMRMIRFRRAAAMLILSTTVSFPVLAQGFNQGPPGQGQGQYTPQMQPPMRQVPPGQMQPGPMPTGQMQPPAMGQPPMGPPPGFGPPPGASPGFGPPPGGTAQQRPNLADELTDFGVPPQATLQANVGSETPLTIPGGHVITTMEMRQAAGSEILFIDVWNTGAHPSLPGAILMPGAGNAGSFTDDTQQRLWTALSQLTNQQAQRPLVFFCTGPRCWESYNAALRAINMGFKTVLWYRGGLASWQAFW